MPGAANKSDKRLNSVPSNLSDVPNWISSTETTPSSRKALYARLRASIKTDDANFRLLTHWVLEPRNDQSLWPKKVACGVLPAFADSKFDEVVELVWKLAKDESWEVREDVTYAVRDFFDFDFARMYKRVWTICESGPDCVARAIAIGIARHCRHRVPAEAQPVLDLMSMLAYRSDQYVRKNLGPFAIGDYLYDYYPKETLERVLKDWIQKNEECVRWNAAMSFSTAVAARYFDEACFALDALATDPRLMVWRATASAMVSLYRRTGGRPHDIVMQWTRDERRRFAGEYVLSHVSKVSQGKKDYR